MRDFSNHSSYLIVLLDETDETLASAVDKLLALRVIKVVDV